MGQEVFHLTPRVFFTGMEQLPSLKLTASLPLQIGYPERKLVFQPHPFSGSMLVSGRVPCDF